MVNLSPAKHFLILRKSAFYLHEGKPGLTSIRPFFTRSLEMHSTAELEHYKGILEDFKALRTKVWLAYVDWCKARTHK